MKLLSTEFGENSIELLFADNADLEVAGTVLSVRLPKAPDHTKPIAYNRYWALNDLQEMIRELMNADRDSLENQGR